MNSSCKKVCFKLNTFTNNSKKVILITYWKKVCEGLYKTCDIKVVPLEIITIPYSNTDSYYISEISYIVIGSFSVGCGSSWKLSNDFLLTKV